MFSVSKPRGFRASILSSRSLFALAGAALLFVWVSGVLLFISSASSSSQASVPHAGMNHDDILRLQLAEGINNTKWEPPTSEGKSQLAEEEETRNIELTPPIPVHQEAEEDHPLDKQRGEAVKQAFLHAWNNYKTYAFGADEIKPISKQPDNNWGGTAATLVDALDTMYIMGLKEEFDEARNFVETKLSFDKDWGASTFETTIRYLGGLLSTYELSGDKVFLDKAVELAERLLPAFSSPTGIPYATVNLKTKRAWSPDWAGGASFLSEFGTLQLEWMKLSQLTGDPKYAEAVEKVMDTLLNVNTDPWDGLYPTQFHPDAGKFTNNHITFGARGDSFYEYLLKQWLLTGKTDTRVKKVYDRAMEGMKKHLVLRSEGGNGQLTYIAEMNNRAHIHKMDHLVCFAAGMLALDGNPEHLKLAEEIGYTCWQFYERNPTGIAPEIAGFDPSTVKAKGVKDFYNQAAHYLLRPETVESMMILYRVTGKEKYKEWGWRIFEAIEKHCRVEGGYSGIKDVGRVPVQYDNRMESFFLAETLKYLYLLFSPKTYISLDDYVYNTEAHPLRKFTAV